MGIPKRQVYMWLGAWETQSIFISQNYQRKISGKKSLR
jgi:hypothetical protein